MNRVKNSLSFSLFGLGEATILLLFINKVLCLSFSENVLHFVIKAPSSLGDASISRTQVQTYDKRCEHKKFKAGLRQCHPDIAVV